MKRLFSSISYKLRTVIPKFEEKLKEIPKEDVNFTLKCLVSHILSKDFSSIKNLEDEQLDSKQLEHLERLVECRLARIPIQYIIKEWDFYSLKLKMVPSVFIPRPETEKLVSMILEENNVKERSFLEIGSGSGAISVSLLKNLLNFKGVAIERNKLAAELTLENAKALNVEDRLTVLNEKLSQDSLKGFVDKFEKFDFIVSNPPYIPSRQVFQLQPEIVLYENMNALNGGPDGLDVIKLILELSSSLLKPNGKLWLEVDSTHPPMIEEIIKNQYENRLIFEGVHKDFTGIDRFVEIKRN
ncbi:HEMK1 family protein [Megaselia abdita]